MVYNESNQIYEVIELTEIVVKTTTISIKQENYDC